MASIKKITEVSSPGKKNPDISLLCLENGIAKVISYSDLFEVKTVSGSLDNIKTGGFYHITPTNNIDLPDPYVWYLEVLGRSGGLMQRAITQYGDMLTRVYMYSASKWSAWKKVCCAVVSDVGGE